MFYVLAIVISAVLWGLRPALFSTILSALFFEIFNLLPTGPLNFDAQNLSILIIFLIVGTVVSIIVTREHTQNLYLRTQATQLANLYEFIRDLAAAPDVNEISKIVVQHVKQVFNWDSIVLIPEGDELIVRYASHGLELDEKDFSIALWTYNQGAVAGFNSEILSTSKKQFLPFTTERGVVGVIGIQPTVQPPSGELNQDRFMQIFIDQAAWAIERAQML
jgi:two-component system sensor histidine kinase KdpD